MAKQNLENTSKLKKNFGRLILIILSGAFIYTLPYFRYYYYDAIKATFGMSDLQMGIAGTWFGLISAFGYIVGGILSDKISLRIIMPASMISTGVAGLYLLTSPSPNAVIAIHIIWAFTSMMSFYPAMMKTIRLLADSHEQGRAFGIFEGGRGIVNAIIFSIAAAIFSFFSLRSAENQGILTIVTFYSVMTIILGVLNIFFLKGIDDVGSESGDQFDIKLIGKLIKNPYLWGMVGIIFCTYMINMSWHLISPYTSLAFGTSAILAVVLNSSTQYIRPFASFSAGFLGDRINASKCMLIGLFLSLIGLTIILFVPEQGSVTPIIIACLFIFFSMYMTQSMHFAVMEEGNFPNEGMGTAIGIICFLGYLPESFAALVSGLILDATGGSTAGYRQYFMILLGFTVLGVLITLFWISKTKEKRTAILAKVKHNN